MKGKTWTDAPPPQACLPSRPAPTPSRCPHCLSTCAGTTRMRRRAGRSASGWASLLFSLFFAYHQAPAHEALQVAVGHEGGERADVCRLSALRALWVGESARRAGRRVWRWRGRERDAMEKMRSERGDERPLVLTLRFPFDTRLPHAPPFFRSVPLCATRRLLHSRAIGARACEEAPARSSHALSLSRRRDLIALLSHALPSPRSLSLSHARSETPAEHTHTHTALLALKARALTR